MNRTAIAFIIGPLWAPLVVTPIAHFEIFPYPAQLHWVVIAGLISTIFAYLGVFLLGLPLFRWLRSRNLTALWMAAALGFVVGVLTWIAAVASFVLLLGGDLHGVELAARDWRMAFARLAGLVAPGLIGIVVGMTIWLIARPDHHQFSLRRQL